jgi:surface carbohydrate biosynthesis protein
MNVYLHVEISARELDSKLLLATLAASKGHEIIVSSLEVIEKGLKKRWLPSGIFHTKSLTPSKTKISRHQEILSSGSKITSIDEETSIDRFGYEDFSKQRYSDKTIEQSSAVFAWGDEDFETLKKNYKNHSNKIHKTGSPRADLWKPFFSNYWSTPKTIPTKPFLLISSNMTICENISFKEKISKMRDTGYFDRSPNLFKERFIWRSNDYLKAIIFIEAIKHLSKNNNGYDIVFRPHPSESVDCWKVLLEGVSNVHVIREGAINSWVKNSFAVMHHACTTAIECSVSKKPLVTYVDSKLKDHLWHNTLSNQLGHLVDSKESLLEKVNSLYDETKKNSKKEISDKLPSLILKKVYLDDKEFAAEKMISIWENILDNEPHKPINLIKLRFFIFKMKINRLIGYILTKLFLSKLTNFRTHKNNEKFAPLDFEEIKNSVSRFQNILSLDKDIECKLISDRTVLIKRKNSK